jgi:hypothetical protein
MAGLILFIILMFSLNGIVLNGILNYPKLSATDMDQYSSTSEVIYGLQETIYIGGIDEKFNVAGYALCESDYSQKDRKVDVLLKGNKSTYRLETKFSSRPDLAQLSSKKVDNNDLFFSTKFSVIQLKDDEYELYLYVQENDKTSGLVKTPVEFAKYNHKYMTIEEYKKALDLEKNEVKKTDSSIHNKEDNVLQLLIQLVMLGLPGVLATLYYCKLTQKKYSRFHFIISALTYSFVILTLRCVVSIIMGYSDYAIMAVLTGIGNTVKYMAVSIFTLLVVPNLIIKVNQIIVARKENVR